MGGCPSLEKTTGEDTPPPQKKKISTFIRTELNSSKEDEDRKLNQSSGIRDKMSSSKIQVT